MFRPDISPYNFLDVNLEDTPLFDMYEDDTIDAEGDLIGKNEDEENLIMDTGLYIEAQLLK